MTQAAFRPPPMASMAAAGPVMASPPFEPVSIDSWDEPPVQELQVQALQVQALPRESAPEQQVLA